MELSCGRFLLRMTLIVDGEIMGSVGEIAYDMYGDRSIDG